MVAQHLTVVGGDHHDRVVSRPQVIQGPQQPADLGVHLGHHPVVGGTQLPEVAGVERLSCVAPRPGGSQERVLGARFVDDRFGYRRRIHHVVVRLRNHERGVRPVDRGVYEPGPAIALQPFQLVDHLAYQEGRLGLVGGERWGRPTGPPPCRCGHVGPRAQEPVRVRDVVPPLLQPPVPDGAVFPDVQDEPETGQGALVVLQAWVVVGDRPRVHGRVRVAEQQRVVAGGTGLQCHVREPGVQRRAVLDRPVDVLVGARQEAGPTRPARGGLGVVGCEPDALGGQAVQVGGLHHRMSRSPEAVASPLVEGDEQDVRTTHTNPPVPGSVRSSCQPPQLVSGDGHSPP